MLKNFKYLFRIHKVPFSKTKYNFLAITFLGIIARLKGLALISLLYLLLKATVEHVVIIENEMSNLLL